MKSRTYIKNPSTWLKISLATIILSLAVIIGIRPIFGIDFVGGSLFEIQGPEEGAIAAREILQEEFNLSATTQATQDDSIIIRVQSIDEETYDRVLDRLQKDEREYFGEELRFETIGPTIGQELRRKTALAVAIVIVAMVMYLAYTFRQTKGHISPWKFGIAAAYALAHDLLLVTAVYVLFGKLWGAEVDTLFVTAQLAILGYSVNDTIVLFDRLVKEHKHNSHESLTTTINRSVTTTLGRSLNTSLTTLLALGAILLFGGSTIRWFVAALAVGTITGAYSSIFVAPPLLWWLNRKNGRR